MLIYKYFFDLIKIECNNIIHFREIFKIEVLISKVCRVLSDVEREFLGNIRFLDWKRLMNQIEVFWKDRNQAVFMKFLTKLGN